VSSESLAVSTGSPAVSNETPVGSTEGPRSETPTLGGRQSVPASTGQADPAAA